MYEFDYRVVIQKTGTGKNTNITGKLSYTFSEYDTDCPIPTEKYSSLHFNPLIILGDLRNKKHEHKYFTERLNIDRSWQYLLDSYEYEYGFGTPLYIGNDEQYLKFVSKLDKIMRNNECMTEKYLEKIQKESNLNLDCRILLETDNIFFELLQKKQRNATKKIYKPLEYNFGQTNDELEPNVYMKKNHQFVYHCHTMADVIFSILHFIVIHQYEFRTCALCQKRYVKIPNHGQGKYCPRNSPLSLNSYFDDNRTNEKFKNLDCQASMKKFHEIMRNMKKNKLRYIPNDEQANKFIHEFDKKNDIVKEMPTLENLTEFYTFTKQYTINS